jgi:hypothetical protein
MGGAESSPEVLEAHQHFQSFKVKPLLPVIQEPSVNVHMRGMALRAELAQRSATTRRRSKPLPAVRADYPRPPTRILRSLLTFGLAQKFPVLLYRIGLMLLIGPPHQFVGIRFSFFAPAGTLFDAFELMLLVRLFP